MDVRMTEVPSALQRIKPYSVYISRRWEFTLPVSVPVNPRARRWPRFARMPKACEEEAYGRSVSVCIASVCAVGKANLKQWIPCLFSPLK